MPDTVLVDIPNSLARPAYDAVMRSFDGRLITIDCRGDLSEDLFIDHTHLNAAGRRPLRRGRGVDRGYVRFICLAPTDRALPGMTPTPAPIAHQPWRAPGGEA
jgi:hypothetical protein